MRAALLWWWFVVETPRPPITVAVTPRVGLAPVTITVRAACDARGPGERVFEIVVLEGDVVVRRSELDADAQAQARPGERLRHTAAWALPAGEYVVAACFQPGSRCSAGVSVSAREVP